MQTRRDHRHRRVLLQIRLEHILSLTALCVILVWVCRDHIGSANASVARCAHAYARARTAADTIAVDVSGAGGRGLPATCGGLRRDGTLDGDRQAVERRAAASAREPLIEK
jgi:hypothetical protein